MRSVRRPWIDRASAGFALAALVLITVAVVAPELEAVTGDDARTLALADANRIGVALRAVTRDAGRVSGSASDTRCWLFGPGVLPRDNAFARRGGFPLSGVLTSNAASVPNWRGPYLARVPIDPWGRAYVVSSEGGDPRRPIMIVSAGPDGVVTTTPRDTTITGDDVGIVLMP